MISAELRRPLIKAAEWTTVAIVPILLAMSVLGLWHWDFSIPLVYAGSDDTWQLVLTKMVTDTGWVLTNPYLGAPGIANWHFNPAAQTSSIHSLIMMAMSIFMDDPIRIQQSYYVLNFSLITLTSYTAARTLGVARVFAFGIGLLFSFTSFRIGWLFYAYLANYFSVPLALIPIFWIMIGKFELPAIESGGFIQGVRGTLQMPALWVSVGCILLVALSDGYYAFFTLLLLGFATATRVMAGDLRTPSRLFTPFVLAITLMVVAVGMTAPLMRYQQQNREEFAPGGREDLAVTRQPFEAEVYSSSLKLLLAPIPEHRIRTLGALGEKVIGTSNAARKFPQSKPIVSFGTLASFLFAACLAAALYLVVNSRSTSADRTVNRLLFDNRILRASIALSLFIFLCSTSGGIGTLLALFYPSIRAYDRFPLLLVFCLLVGAASALTTLTAHIGVWRYRCVTFFLLAVTAASLYDQIPFNAQKGSVQTKTIYLAEKTFVKHIEATLPVGAMVYQYPHSQYQSDNKYYGWGSFAHIRLYLHSKQLRWSNGASKNSAVENWLDTVQEQPILKLISDVAAVGFRGMVIDRTVLPEAEYKEISATLRARSYDIVEDDASKLSFIKLPDPGYVAALDESTLEVRSIYVNAPREALDSVDQNAIPDFIDAASFNSALQAHIGQAHFNLDKATNPDLLPTAEFLKRGSGSQVIVPITDMKGEMRCRVASGAASASEIDTVEITLQNQGDFPWRLGAGAFPLRIGFHLYNAGPLLWDNGVRLPVTGSLKSGDSIELKVKISALGINPATQTAAKTLKFALVQEGHAWFEPVSCSLPLK